MFAEPELLEALKALSPVAFEHWIAERFRELGYSVSLTLASGDHGVDLVAMKEAEIVLVQCKRYRATTVGEPILRDLFGALHHHAGASRAILVTTGRLTRGALEWVSGKPVETWDGHELVRRWPDEIGELAKHKPAGVSGDGIKRKRGDNWFVYTTDDGRRWAAKISPLVGNNPALGFERLDDPTLPELPLKLGPGRVGRPPGQPIRRVKMRYVRGHVISDGKETYRVVPVGTREAWSTLMRGPGTDLLLARSDGSTVLLKFGGGWGGHETFDTAWIMGRARQTWT